jgi:hypothetical protein
VKKILLFSTVLALSACGMTPEEINSHKTFILKGKESVDPMYGMKKITFKTESRLTAQTVILNAVIIDDKIQLTIGRKGITNINALQIKNKHGIHNTKAIGITSYPDKSKMRPYSQSTFLVDCLAMDNVQGDFFRVTGTDGYIDSFFDENISQIKTTPSAEEFSQSIYKHCSTKS